jgi:SAM-dependent methyltransferase
MECVKLINKITKEKEWTHVVEIGCGIGNILRKVKVKNKTGYDISPSAIRAAIFLAKKNKIKYLVGSFNNVKNECFDCLITVNFMHEIPINMLKEFYNNILTDNEIEYLIVDTVGDSYKYQHNFDAILPDNYKKEVVICPFQSGRYLNLYKKQ